MTTVLSQSEVGIPAPSGSDVVRPGNPGRLHHTVTSYITPEEPWREIRSRGFLRILGVYGFKPGWGTKAKILRRYFNDTDSYWTPSGLSKDPEGTYPKMRKWVQMEIRQAGDGRYVVVQVDPERQKQIRRSNRARRREWLARVSRVSAAEKASTRAIDRYHRSLGWNGAGYGEIGYPSGRVHVCRGRKQGAHTVGHNRDFGFAMAGDYRHRTPTKRLRQAVIDRGKAYRISRYIPHRATYGTSCPGVSSAWIADVNRAL